MKKILITGALGHIGSALIHSIKKRAYEEVVLLDNLSTQRYASLFHLPHTTRFRFHEEDVLTANLEKHFEKVEVVIHLAAITSAEVSFERREEVERVNYEGTKRVAEACARTGSKLLFLSTTSVYGTQQTLVDEDCSRDELNPQSPYASSKLKAEEFLDEYGKEKSLKFVTGRFGTIFGPSIGMRFHTAVNKFVWQACFGKPITVWRTALHQMRPYLDLTDAVRAIKFIVDKDLFDNRIYNVLTVNSTVSDIVEIIRRDIPGISVDLVDSKIMNQLSYEVSRERFEATGFKFKGSIERGISDTIRYLNAFRPPASHARLRSTSTLHTKSR